jgi:predicted phage tail protein
MLTKELIRMEGAGGGGKSGSGSGPQEAPNSLQSKAIVKLLELLGEGPIQGFPADNAAKNVVLNSGSPDSTPLMDASGNYTVKGASIDYRLGAPSQTPIQGFDEQVTTVAVGTQVSNNGDPISNAIVRRVSDTTTSAVRLIMQLSSLLQVDTKTGDQNGYSVEYAIDVKPNATGGGVYVEKVHDRITGKTVSPWQKAYRIQLDGVGPWDIRVRRVSPDDSSTSTQSVTSWFAYETITEYKLGYPYSAIVALTADTEQFGTQMPQRGYEVEGLIVQVPSNYDAVNRLYSGVWNGTFTTAYTNNPAWILYDILTNNRYGLGDVFTAARLALGKWDLYNIAKYCDAYNERPSGTTNDYNATTGKHGVSDFDGGYEPRFTFNGVLKDKTSAYDALSTICGMFRTVMMWTGGQLRFMQDRLLTPVKVFSPANVIEGFNYTGTALRARHTAARVTWSNPDLQYQEDDVLYEDPDAIARYGYNLKEEAAVGCTSYGQAMRHARNILTTERLETDSVTFKVSGADCDILPGQIMKISDPMMTTAEWAGRLVSVVGTLVTFDRPLQFAAGRTYTVTIVTASGQLVDKVLTNPGVTSNTANMTAVLASTDIDMSLVTGTQDISPWLPVPNGMYAISSDVLVPRLFRLISIARDDDDTYKLMGVEYDPSKYALIENGYVKPAPFYSDLPSAGSVEPPTNLTLAFSSVKTSTGTDGVIEINWSASTDYYIAGYIVEYQYGLDNWVRLPQQTGLNARLINPKSGAVRVRVSAINQFGIASTGVTADLDISTGTAVGKSLVTNLTLVDGTTSWTGTDVSLIWQAAPIYGTGSLQTDGKDPYFSKFRIRVKDAVSNAVIGTYYSTDTKFVLPYDQMVAIGLARTYKIGVALVDISGGVSNELVVTFTNPAPLLVTPTVTSSPMGFSLLFPAPADPDFEGIIVWRSTTSGFTPGTGNKVWKNKGNPSFDGMFPGQVFYYRYALYDSFGEVGLNISAEQSLTIPAIDITYMDTTPPAVPTGLAISSAVATDAAGNPYTVLTATWNANTDTDLSGYEVSLQQASGTFTDYPTTSTNYKWAVVGNTSYTVKVRAVDKFGNRSSYSSTQNLTTARDTTAPALPTGFAVTSGYAMLWLNWTNPADADLCYVEIWENTVNNSATATKLTTVLANPGSVGAYTRSGLTSSSGTRFFWLKAGDTSFNVSGFTAVQSGTPGLVATSDLGGFITADQIATGFGGGGVNLVMNGDAEGSSTTATPGWKIGNFTSTGSTFTTAAGQGVNGGNAFVATKTASANQSSGRMRAVPVQQSTPYNIKAKAKADTATTAGFYLRVYFFSAIDAQGYGTTAAGSTIDLTGAANAALGATYGTPFDQVVTTPAGARYMALEVINYITSTALNIYLDDVYILEQLSTNQISTSFITGSMLQAGVIDITKFATGLAPVEKVGALPTTANFQGRIVFLTTDSKIYRWTDTSTTGSTFWTKTSDGADIAANSITSGKIVAGAIQAADLAAKIITADKILIGDSANQIYDPEYRSVSTTGTPFWIQQSGGTIPFSTTISSDSNVTTAQPTGLGISRGLKFDLTGSTTGSFNGISTTSTNYIGVQPGQAYRLVCPALIKAGWNGRLAIQLQWYTAAGAYTGVTDAMAYGIYTNNPAPADVILAGTVTAASGKSYVVAPANASLLSIIISPSNLSTVPAGVAYLGNPFLNRMADGNLIVDGSISAIAISANSITTEKLVMATRGINVAGIEFTHNSGGTTNLLGWTAGTISYVDDSGTVQSVSITAGTAAWTTGVLYAYWTQGSTTLSTTTAAATALASNVALMAQYRGGTDLIVTNGRTIIDGSKIYAASIGAGTLAASSVTATNIAAGAVTTASMTAGAINGDRITAGTISATAITAGTALAGSITVSGSSLTTISGNAANGQTAFSGTTNYRTTGAPTNNPAPSGITITDNTNGTRNIQLNWGAYTQGANKADFLILFWNKTTTAPTINDASVSFSVNTSGGSYYVFEGVNPANNFSFGIAAARRTENGLEIGTIVSPTSAPQWVNITTGTANFTANVGGTVAATVVANAALGAQDPGTRINAASTQINPGLILISGAISLANWRNGTDNTKIEGGSIAANTITANKLTIGNRNVNFIDLNFQATGGGGTLTWTQGYAQWVDVNGANQQVTVTGGSVSTPTGQYLYVYWALGSTTLTTTNSLPALDNAIVLCTWLQGTKFFSPTYGATIIDGTRITTGTITASQIAANTITAGQIAASTITATQIAGNTITASQIAANTITAGQIATGTITATQMAANSVTATQITAGAVTASKISVSSLDAITVNLGTMTATSGDGSQTIISGWGMVQKDGSGNVRVAIGNLTQLGV